MKTLKYFVLCIFCTTITTSNGMVKILDYSEKMEVTDCIERIIETTESTVDITVVNFKEINDLLFLGKKESKFSSRSFLLPENILPNQLYVVKCVNYAELQHGVQQLRNDFLWNPRGKFVIVIEHLNGHIRLVSSLLIKFNIFNVTVVAPGESDYEIYGFDPQSDPCGKPAITTLERITQCSRLKATENLFRFKTPKTFRGCNVKVTSTDYWPFISFNKTHGLGTTQHLLNWWAESAGLNIELVKHKNEEGFGTVLDNFTFTGMMSLIEAGEANAAAGGLIILYARARALDFSYPYTVDYTRAVVARAPLMTNWRAVLWQFSLHVTINICIFVAFFCFAVVYFSIFVKKKKDVVRDIFIVFGYICSNISVDTRTIKTNNSLRLIVCCMLIFVFFMSFFIQAYLLSVTTNPLREHQIKHMDEALAKCKPLKSSMFMATSGKDSPNCTTIEDCFMKLLKKRNQKLYVLVGDTNIDTVAFQFVDSKGEQEVVKTLEPLHQLLRAAYFERGSSLLSNFNRLTQVSEVSGFKQKVFKDLLHLMYLKQAKHNITGEPPEWLHQFRDVFLVLIVGYSLATIVFIYECKSYFKNIIF